MYEILLLIGLVTTERTPNPSVLPPDWVAMVLATVAAHQSDCAPPLPESDYPLNLAVAKLGQDLVDFMPDGRYAPLVSVKLAKAREWERTQGVSAACSGMAETLKRFLPDIFGIEKSS
jgi:hypothetical protein